MPSKPMAKEKGIAKKEKIRELFRRGKLVKGPTFTIRIIKDSGPYEPAIIISSKAIKGAVQRNRLRRKIKAALREIMPLDRPLGIAVVVRSSASNKSYQQIKEELASLIRQNQ